MWTYDTSGNLINAETLTQQFRIDTVGPGTQYEINAYLYVPGSGFTNVGAAITSPTPTLADAQTALTKIAEALGALDLR